MAGGLVILTIGLPWVGAIVVWLAGRGPEKLLHALAVSFAVLSGAAGLALLTQASSATVVTFPVGGVFGDFTFVADGLGVFLSAIATVIGCLAVIFSVDYMHGEQQLNRYYAFVLFFIGAMAGLVLSNNLL